MAQTKSLLANLPKRGYLAVGLFLRLVLAPFLSHPFDMRVFMAVGAAVSRGMTPYGQYTLQHMFAETPHPNLYGVFPGIGYPPPWGLICGLMYLLSSAVAPNNLYAYVFALKMPIILGELATAVLVYNILKARKDEGTASKAFLFFLFCPFIIATGTVWGMLDVLALFFALLSIHTLYDNWKHSSVYLAVASVLKVFPLTLAPLYSLVLYKATGNLKKAVLFLLSTIAFTSFLTFTPMVVFSWPVSNLQNAIVYHVTTTNPSYDGQAAFPYGAASPFNVLTLVNYFAGQSFEPPLFFIYFWIPACIAVYALFSKRSYPRDGGKENCGFMLVVQWSLLLMLTLFTTRVWVSEQNLVFLFGFFALTVFLQNPQEFGKVQLLWMFLSSFVVVHVPIIAFFWLPFPWTLNAASSFADGPLGWTRLLCMTFLTFSWLALSWHYIVKKLRW
jgi:hypothetical protein